MQRNFRKNLRTELQNNIVVQKTKSNICLLISAELDRNIYWYTTKK
jgi:hypothetical protein